MIEIHEAPEKPICSACGPLAWGYFPKTKDGARWVDFTFDEGRLVPHVCTNRPQMRWEPSPEMAERAHRGRRLVQDALEGKPITEENARG